MVIDDMPWVASGPRFSLTTVSLIVLLLGMWVDGVWTLECERQRMVGRHIYTYPALWNHSIVCPFSFQWEWTLSRICCYDNYDRFYEHPYCCYSEMYKLVVAVGFICLLLLGTSFLLFFCWFYNLPHHVLYILTFRKFQLNNWMLKAQNGPYVDPSFYAKEPFWSRGADASSQLSYPLRPMPPRIFYPAPPTNLKFRGWDLGGGDSLPLFVLASRQFHRHPYSARPNDRTPPALPASTATNTHVGGGGGETSRRSSIGTVVESERGSALAGGRRGSGWRNNNAATSTSNITSIVASGSTSMSMSNSGSNNATGQHRPSSSEAPFIIPMDEEEAATELREAIRLMDTDNTKSEDEPTATSWSIAGDLLGQPTTDTIFMTTSSRELIRSQKSTCSPSCRNTEARRNSTDDIDHHRDRTNNFREHQGCSSSTSVVNNDRMVAVTRVRFGGKVSVQLLNQQLSNSLGLSLNNLPNIQVIGNFGRDGMETITEDDDPLYDEEELGYSPSSISSKESLQVVSTIKPSVAVEESPRISSALDRIVTRARQDVPFCPSLPGAIPENPDDNGESDGPLSRRRKRLNRTNSAPVNF